MHFVFSHIHCSQSHLFLKRWHLKYNIAEHYCIMLKFCHTVESKMAQIDILVTVQPLS